MGWSEAGLSKMAMIRVFVLNGGKVQPDNVTAWKGSSGKQSKIIKFEKYDAIIRQQQNIVLKDAKNWSWFDRESTVTGKRTGTKATLDALCQTRKIS